MRPSPRSACGTSGATRCMTVDHADALKVHARGASHPGVGLLGTSTTLVPNPLDGTTAIGTMP